MRRAFDEHCVRAVSDLGGAWRFLTDPEDRGEREGWSGGLPAGETVSVPSLWNNEKGLLHYHDVAWYERKFYTAGGTLRFVFESVQTASDVWLDGKPLGSHYGGFTAFDFIVRDVAAGEHTLTVRADSRFDEHSIPQKRVDWYNYGGIARDVWAETLCGVCVLNGRFEYELSEDLKSARAFVTLELYNAGNDAEEAPVTATVGEWVVYEDRLVLAAGERRTVRSEAIKLEGFALWSCETPTLYPFTVKTATDDLVDRVGFRKIEVKDGRISLNGEAIELRGVNRHEDYPGFGFAFPRNLMKRDLDIIFDLGCNTVRGSHYPNSKYFVDLLDERGMLFWSEIPIWGVGFSVETLGDPIVVERGLEMHREMIRDYYNHPCIIIWGMHNEIPSQSEEAYAMTKLYHGFLRSNGGNRLITHASNHPMDDICFEFSDILSLNMYYGWYDQEKIGLAKDWEGFLENFRARREKLGLADRPVIMSEFGAGALYGYRNGFDTVFWTEEYQSEILEHCVALFHNDPMIAGFYVWQFCNILTSAGLAWRDRARCFNNKGLLDEYRNPKLAYRTVKALYAQFAKENGK
jgi:beta-glucuronidase